MNQLRVRMYNVGFGEAILISFPEIEDHKEVIRHILVDMGNASKGDPGDNDLFRPMIADLIKETGGVVDLFVVTHEHMDHVQGPLFCAKRLKQRFRARQVWMTPSVEDGYYDSHPKAREKNEEGEKNFRLAASLALGFEQATNSNLAMLLFNNNRFAVDDTKGTDLGRTNDCNEFIKKLTDAENVYYVHRTYATPESRLFTEATIDVLAPEEDSSDYYGKMIPLAPSAIHLLVDSVRGSDRSVAPPGVDPDALSALLASLAHGVVEALMAIDEAANDTSVVFCLNWRGRRLMFTGDCEGKSWQMMWKKLKTTTRLAPVDFFKVSHHASKTGIPIPQEMLERILPANRPEGPVPAGVSTAVGAYDTIPALELMAQHFSQRCQIAYTHLDSSPDRPWLDFYLSPKITQP